MVALIARRITRPLAELSQTAEKIGRGETVSDLPIKGPLEVVLTMSAFARMQERIKRFVDGQTSMLAAISHDLKTPITSLRLRAEFIEDTQLKEAMIDSLDELQTMVASCLSFARQDAANEPVSVIDLIAMLEDLSDEHVAISFETDLLQYDYKCQPVSIKRAMRNLTSNAIQYGEHARIMFRPDEGNLVISITDGGPGIPVQLRETVFAPFTRLDEARSTGEGNVGLGLAIARSIIRQHGGEILAVDIKGEFTMQVSLPT